MCFLSSRPLASSSREASRGRSEEGGGTTRERTSGTRKARRYLYHSDVTAEEERKRKEEAEERARERREKKRIMKGFMASLGDVDCWRVVGRSVFRSICASCIRSNTRWSSWRSCSER